MAVQLPPDLEFHLRTHGLQVLQSSWNFQANSDGFIVTLCWKKGPSPGTFEPHRKSPKKRERDRARLLAFIAKKRKLSKLSNNSECVSLKTVKQPSSNSDHTYSRNEEVPSVGQTTPLSCSQDLVFQPLECEQSSLPANESESNLVDCVPLITDTQPFSQSDVLAMFDQYYTSPHYEEVTSVDQVTPVSCFQNVVLPPIDLDGTPAYIPSKEDSEKTVININKILSVYRKDVSKPLPPTTLLMDPTSTIEDCLHEYKREIYMRKNIPIHQNIEVRVQLPIDGGGGIHEVVINNHHIEVQDIPSQFKPMFTDLIFDWQ